VLGRESGGEFAKVGAICVESYEVQNEDAVPEDSPSRRLTSTMP